MWALPDLLERRCWTPAPPDRPLRTPGSCVSQQLPGRWAELMSPERSQGLCPNKACGAQVRLSQRPDNAVAATELLLPGRGTASQQHVLLKPAFRRPTREAAEPAAAPLMAVLDQRAQPVCSVCRAKPMASPDLESRTHWCLFSSPVSKPACPVSHPAALPGPGAGSRPQSQRGPQAQHEPQSQLSSKWDLGIQATVKPMLQPHLCREPSQPPYPAGGTLSYGLTPK